jgi:hypothetical protein
MFATMPDDDRGIDVQLCTRRYPSAPNLSGAGDKRWKELSMRPSVGHWVPTFTFVKERK